MSLISRACAVTSMAINHDWIQNAAHCADRRAAEAYCESFEVLDLKCSHFLQALARREWETFFIFHPSTTYFNSF
jgi:hypothetical protein